MLVRSGKIQFLFWVAFFSVMLYLMLIAIGLETFVLPDEKPIEIPYNTVMTMFALYGMLALALLSGIVVSTMIDNSYYQTFFGVMLAISFFSILATKGLFG